MLTREEYKTYLRLKKKLGTQDVSTQTHSTSKSDTKQESENESSKSCCKERRGRTMKRRGARRSSGGTQTIIIPFPFMEDVGKKKNKKRYFKSDDEDDAKDNDESEQDSDDEDYEEETSSGSDTDEDVQDSKPENAKDMYDDDEYAYYKRLSKKQRVAIDATEKEIREINVSTQPLRFKILESDMDMRLKALAISKVEQLSMLDPSSSEYYKLTNWIEHLCKIPIGKYKKLPIDSTAPIEEIAGFLESIKTTLASKVYGHEESKEAIVRLLGKWIANPQSKGLVIGIEGKMGCGKTSLCNAICESLNLPFGFVQLGGISDGSYLIGHSYTYEGSRWGRIAEILMRVGCMNPVLYFDELDKISTSRYGEEIVNLLIHLTDASQNDKFHDKYFSDIELDMSKSLIVFSYNDASLINPILRDRMITIKTDGYKPQDKLHIAKDYMLPIILKEFSFSEGDIVFPEDVISHIINKTKSEDGVRNLKRSLEEVVSQLNLYRLLKKPLFPEDALSHITFPLTVTTKIVNKFLKTSNDTDNFSHQMMYM